MIFVDIYVLIYAVGNLHPPRDHARKFFAGCQAEDVRLFTSAEMLQELVHVCLRVGRLDALDATTTLATDAGAEIWSLEAADVTLARRLHERYPQLTSRDLCHLACCQRRGLRNLRTFDSGLRDVVGEPDESR